MEDTTIKPQSIYRGMIAGKWWFITTEDQFQRVLTYGRLDRSTAHHVDSHIGIWGGPGYYREVEYTRVSEEHGLQQVRELLTQQDVQEKVTELIMEYMGVLKDMPLVLLDNSLHADELNKAVHA